MFAKKITGLTLIAATIFAMGCKNSDSSNENVIKPDGPKTVLFRQKDGVKGQAEYAVLDTEVTKDMVATAEQRELLAKSVEWNPIDKTVSSESDDMGAKPANNALVWKDDAAKHQSRLTNKSGGANFYGYGYGYRPYYGGYYGYSSYYGYGSVYPYAYANYGWSGYAGYWPSCYGYNNYWYYQPVSYYGYGGYNYSCWNRWW